MKSAFTHYQCYITVDGFLFYFLDANDLIYSHLGWKTERFAIHINIVSAVKAVQERKVCKRFTFSHQLICTASYNTKRTCLLPFAFLLSSTRYLLLCSTGCATLSVVSPGRAHSSRFNANHNVTDSLGYEDKNGTFHISFS